MARSRLLYCFCSLLFMLLGVSPAYAVELDAPDEVTEGWPFVVRVFSEKEPASVKVRWLKKTVYLTPREDSGTYVAEGLLGLGMKEKLRGRQFALRVDVKFANGKKKVFKKLIKRKNKAYPEQKLTVSKKFTALSKKDVARYKRERKDIGRALSTISKERYWTCPVMAPLSGEITSLFGVRRFFNGKPRSPHGGLDIDGEKGDPVRACMPGKVILAADHFFAGNSVYVDHGQGVISMYFHLSEINVKAGDMVRTGELLGLVGSTGRVTGPHLHFGLSVTRQMVDPTPMIEGEMCTSTEKTTGHASPQ